MEKEAYERARAFDVETIIRQTEMIGSLRRENDTYHALVQELKRKLDEQDDSV